MMRLPFVVVLSLCLLAPSAVEAQDYVTTQWVFLRRQASNTGAKIRTLSPGKSLAARTAPERPGFVPVRTADGVAGWVGERFVRDLRAEALSASTFLSVGASGAADQIDSTWDKPSLVTSTIKIRTDSGQLACGPRGRSKRPDDGTNYQKNRTDVPTSSHLVTVDAIRALNDTALWRIRGLPPHRTRWTGDDSALVTPYEGIPVTVEGYFEVVKPQSKTKGESPNCNAYDERDTDWHIALIATPSESEGQAVVIEPTPRSKRRNKGWTPEKAAAIAVRHDSKKPARDEASALRVRVTGFLMMDPVHPDHIEKGYRATLWEIHPVTQIEVLVGNRWVDFNEFKLPP
ncbi:MAG: hypothetical protein Q8K82_10425 [Gemmatimonadaceae bacterium]|nr:hypothetical protein [Gemmatimonadaceae bacterium]